MERRLLLIENPLVAYLSLFRAIPEGDQMLIDAAFKARSFKEDETLFNGGQICNQMFFILSGVLRILVNSEAGRQSIHFFVSENRFCTILNSFNNQIAADELIQAACPTRVLAISRNQLLQLYSQIPYLKDLLHQITQQALLDKIKVRNAYLGLDAASQYQLFLVQQPDIATRVSQRDIASYLGITPQSLSRIRKNIR